MMIKSTKNKKTRNNILPSSSTIMESGKKKISGKVFFKKYSIKSFKRQFKKRKTRGEHKIKMTYFQKPQAISWAT